MGILFFFAVDAKRRDVKYYFLRSWARKCKFNLAQQEQNCYFAPAAKNKLFGCTYSSILHHEAGKIRNAENHRYISGRGEDKAMMIVILGNL